MGVYEHIVHQERVRKIKLESYVEIQKVIKHHSALCYLKACSFQRKSHRNIKPWIFFFFYIVENPNTGLNGTEVIILDRNKELKE